MHTPYKLLPEHITIKIQHRSNLMKTNKCDSSLTALNAEITSVTYIHTNKIYERTLKLALWIIDRTDTYFGRQYIVLFTDTNDV